MGRVISISELLKKVVRLCPLTLVSLRLSGLTLFLLGNTLLTIFLPPCCLLVSLLINLSLLVASLTCRISMSGGVIVMLLFRMNFILKPVSSISELFLLAMRSIVLAGRGLVCPPGIPYGLHWITSQILVGLQSPLRVHMESSGVTESTGLKPIFGNS